MTTSFCKQTAAAVAAATTTTTTAARVDCARGLRRVTVIETMRENTRVIKTIKDNKNNNRHNNNSHNKWKNGKSKMFS